MTDVARFPDLRMIYGITLALVATVACEDSRPSNAYVPRPRGTLTFTKDVAPIIFHRCSPCHQPGQAAPFPLLTYQDVHSRAQLVASVTDRRYMPPWLPEPGFGDFAGDRSLTSDEIGMIRQWVDEGAIEGDPADLPHPPRLTADWPLGPPDLIVEMPEPYALAAEGKDVYRNFVIPVPIATARYVRSVDIRPGNRRVVHHARLMIDATESSRQLDDADPDPGFDGMSFISEARSPDGYFIGWAPGKMPQEGTEGLSWQLGVNTDLVLQLHLRPTGKPEVIRAAVGLYFAQTAPTHTPAVIKLGSDSLDIPPGTRDYVVRDTFLLPVDVNALGVYPHAHYLGKEMQGLATLPDGTTKWLIWITDWNFDWQDEYRFASAVFLPSGTKLTMRFTYDNSTDNPRNPHHPPRRVVTGPNSTDEMAEMLIQVLPRDHRDLGALHRALAHKYRDAEVKRLARSEYNLGYTLQSQGKLVDAIRHYRRSLDLKPDEAIVHVNIGTALAAAGSLDEAITHYRQALQIDPDNAQAHYNLGNAAMTRGRLDEASDHYRRALQLKPDYADAHNNLGNAIAAEGRLDEAINHYRQALRSDSDNAQAHYNLGNAAMAQGRLVDAINHYGEALRLEPNEPRVLDNLGSALAAQGKSEEAIGYFRRALEIRPEQGQTHGNLGNALATQGKLEEAIHHYRLALRLDTADADAHYNLGIALAAKGEITDAITHTRAAIALRPDWTKAMNALAWTLATHPDNDIRQPKEAIRLAHRAATITGNRDPVVLNTLAAAYAADGQFELAVMTVQEAIAAANATGAEQLATQLAAVLELYRERQPYRQPQRPPASNRP